MRRTTRSQSRQGSQTTTATAPLPNTPFLLKNAPQPPSVSWTLSTLFTPKLTGLSRSSTALLNNKRDKLRASISRLRRTTESHLAQALDATLVFVQEEAGTAVCISPTGLLLTCSHCVADDAASALDTSIPHWLIFATGVVVRAVCIAWDARRDLALLQITHAEPPTHSTVLEAANLPSSPTFPCATVSPPVQLVLTTPLLCIGHPGSEDLEASTPGQATGYDVLHVSEGAYCGMAKGQDPQDNSEIGALMHDCWTYWGHSGAPILEKRTAAVVGLHSSWDEETGMRRGVAVEAVRAFLEEYTTLKA
ncbi:hypothetical protein BU23DRAFT_213311 [Bimuria novae-zelandiae CBS 107.79]|uniref:Trypsin-like serine protease n=1 Tax=Bimuria novae-zelandiae CBS 107.79 TaxID=1447943 RepID=A0A6A5V1X9_9PLEO|nr:hypothetical protein BU23DRAFT_213311 [Bimuria novae-zelandiae CBS 107.79]